MYPKPVKVLEYMCNKKDKKLVCKFCYKKLIKQKQIINKLIKITKKVKPTNQFEILSKKDILKHERLNNLVFAGFSLKEIIFSPKHSQLTFNEKKSQPTQYLRNILEFPNSCIPSQVPTDYKSAPIESIMYPFF
ncbi:phosphoinositide phosphatase sac9-related [Anaeramoeba flamelloides]|uniref:Phosphoinositide phosphatase sac9-related n=1 Tax=Anaeramoeba flamelloides TaxID=1746091 RepID=A0ABQ8ZF39_9EUKA|nr:phosphoinositide phosphatase sac9-related [Anaeramoeba flamelloides]